MATFNFCPNLSLAGCITCKTRDDPGEPDKDPGALLRDRVLVVYNDGVDDNLCVLGPGTIEDEVLLTPNEHDTGEWDGLSVDSYKRTLLLSGPIFNKFKVEDEFVLGKHITDIFTGNFQMVISSLVDAMFKKAKPTPSQINCVYQYNNLTMIAFPLKSHKGLTVGAQLFCRPTRFGMIDIQKLLAQQEDPDDGSVSAAAGIKSTQI